VLETRRHRLIWLAVGGAHLVALGAVWFGGAIALNEPPREGGLVMVNLVSEPVALPGEAKGGVALGAGSPAAAPVSVVPSPSSETSVVRAQTAPVAAPAAAVAVATKGAVLAAVPAPVAEAFVPPSFRFRQEPAYPERARRAGAEGVVGVRLVLSSDGAVRSAELTRSSGSRLLDEAALAAARASTFAPASRNGLPVEAEAVASYRFELR
jgi:protein TonB